MNKLTSHYLGIAAAVAIACAATAPAQASLTADGITYSLLEGSAGQYTLDITGINGPSDTEGGRYGVNALAFNQPSGFISATAPSGFSFGTGGLNSSGCDGTGNFFCFSANSTPTGPALAANSSLSFNFTVSAPSLAGWDPDFKIDWTGSKNNYDLVSLPLAPELPTTQAPEIDPASAMSAMTLLAGGLAVIRGRRRKK